MTAWEGRPTQAGHSGMGRARSATEGVPYRRRNQQTNTSFISLPSSLI
jgi:hypothetical protein